jgi:hypothetical protein
LKILPSKERMSIDLFSNHFRYFHARGNNESRE